MKTGFKVCDAMTTSPIIVSPDTTIKECAKVMKEHNLGSLLIEEGHKFVGIVTDTDFIQKVLAAGLDPEKIPVSKVMSTDLKTITPEKDIFDAIIIMKNLKIRHLPVVDNKLVGYLTLKDVLKIEPQLFDLMVEEIELREESKKPIFTQRENEGICEICGNYAESLVNVDGSMACTKCKNKVE